MYSYSSRERKPPFTCRLLLMSTGMLDNNYISADRHHILCLVNIVISNFERVLSFSIALLACSSTEPTLISLKAYYLFTGSMLGESNLPINPSRMRGN